MLPLIPSLHIHIHGIKMRTKGGIRRIASCRNSLKTKVHSRFSALIIHVYVIPLTRHSHAGEISKVMAEIKGFQAFAIYHINTPSHILTHISFSACP